MASRPKYRESSSNSTNQARYNTTESNADLQSRFQTDIKILQDILQKGEIQIRSGSINSSNYSPIIVLNSHYVNLGALTKVEKMDKKIVPIDFNSIKPGEQQKFISIVLENKNTNILEAALRTPWLKNYAPFQSLTQLLLHMITLGNNTPALGCMFFSHSDEIEWSYVDPDGNSLFHLVLANPKLDHNLIEQIFQEKRNMIKTFINKINESNDTLLSMACKRQLQPVIEVLIELGASILIQEPKNPEIWILPTFSYIHLGVHHTEYVIYIEFTNGTSCYSLIANPAKVYLKPSSEFTPFEKMSPRSKQEFTHNILKSPSSNLISLILENQSKENVDLFFAVEHASPTVLSKILKKTTVSFQTQKEMPSENNIIHIAIEVKQSDNLEVLMKICQKDAITANLDARNKQGETPLDLAFRLQCHISLSIIFNERKDFMDKQWLTEVEKAISNDNIEILRTLMNYFNVDYHEQFMYEKTDDQGLSILHIAVKKFKSEEAFDIILKKYKSQSAIKKQNLIDCKINSLIPNLKGQTPLLLSLIDKKYLATEMLLKAGAANLNEGEQCYFHYLIKFCQEEEELKELEKLLNIDLEPKQFSQCTKPSKVKIWEVTDNESNTLLHYSVKYRNSIVIDLLGKITPFTDLMKLDSKGNSLLHTAATLHQHPIVIDSIIDILKKYHSHEKNSELLNLQNENDGCTALMLAVQSDHFKFVESLIREYASILPVNHEGDSILHIAAKLGRENIFKLILDIVDECKRDRTDNLILHQPNSEGYSPIQCAVVYAKIKIVQLFRERHSLCFSDYKTGYSLLHLVVSIKSVDLQVHHTLIAELLTDRSLLDIKDRHGRTPLLLSTIMHKVDIVNIFLQYQPDLLAIDSQGLSLLHNAVISYDKKTFIMILNAINSDKNSKQILNFKEMEQKKTVLHYLIEKNNKEATEEILKLSLSLESEDIEGNTYLHVASKSPGTVDILKLILGHAKKSSKNFSELEKLNKSYFTPLFYAIFNQNYEACKTLVGEKANLVYRTVDGLAFHETVGGLPLTICEYQHSYHIGYRFLFESNLSWILSPLNNLNIAKNTLDKTIKVPKDLNDHLVQEIVNCQLFQPLQSLLQQVNFSNFSPHRKKLMLYILAVQFGSLPVIQFLIKNYFSPHELMNLNHGNILYEAIHNPNIEIVKVLCDTVVEKHHFTRIDKILSRKQGCDYCALELCVKLQRLKTFQYFLQPKFWLSLELKNPEGTTLFHYILENIRVSETRKQFLDILAAAIQDRENRHHKSTYINNTPLVDCHIQDSGETPLHLCASKYPDCICTILQFNPSPIKEDSSGNTALHLSVKSDNFNCTKKIINAYKNSGIAEIINKTNMKKQTPLHIAVKIANLEFAELLLCNNSKLIAVDDENRTVLHYAVQIDDSSNSKKMVQFLLKHETNNPEPNQSLSTYQDTKGYTPLHSAIVCSNLEAMNVLLRSKFDFKTTDIEGNSILHLALLHSKSLTILISILEIFHKDVESIHASNESTLINLKNNRGQTAIILAVETENVDALSKILRYFPLLHLTDNDGNSCLHKAVESASDLRCLVELLKIINTTYPDEMKSYLSVINANGLSPLHHAIMNQNHRAAEKICEYGANIAIQLPNGNITLCNGQELQFNIGIGPPSSNWKWIKNIVWSDAKDYFICYAIVDKGTTHHIASLLPDLEFTAITTTNITIITAETERALENICSCHCIAPLIYAIDKGWIDFERDEENKQWKVLCGKKSKEVSDYLYTTYPNQIKYSKIFKALEIAAQTQNKEGVLLFLQNHPNLGILESNKITDLPKKTDENTQIIKNSLEYSIDNSNTDILNILLQHGAHFNNLYGNDDTLLHIIIRKKRPVSFLISILEKNKELQLNNSEQLIEGISMINHRNGEGKTPLHVCIEIGDVELLKKLLEYQPDLTLSDGMSNNILHCVAKLGSESIAKIIFDHFPNGFPEIFFEKNKDGCTPLHLAAAFGNVSICSTLLEEGADLYASDTLEQTTLHHSLKNENKKDRLAICKLILQQHSDRKIDFIKCQDAKGLSALHIAVKLQYTDEVDLILRADPTAVYLTDNELQTPLHLAVVPTSSDSTVVTPPSNEILDQILKTIVKPEVCTLDTHHSNGRLICHQDINSRTALHISIASKYDYATYQLLKAHACLDLTDANEDTILHEAVKHPEGPTVIEYILQQIKQRNLNIQDFLSKANRQGLRPLHLAIIHKNLQSVRLLSPDTTLSFENSSGKITLCDNIGSLNLRFLEDRVNQKYYTGYYFQLSRNTNIYLVHTDLPNFDESVFDESCNFCPLRKFDNIYVLEVLVKCRSHEPLSSLIRLKKLALTDKIRDGLWFVQFSAEFASPQVMEYILEILHDRTVFESIDEGPSLIECAVLNSNTDTLKLLMTTLTSFQEKDENQQAAISECLMSSVKKSLDEEKSIALEILLRHKGCLSCLYGNDKGTLLHHVILRMKGNDSNYAELILNVAKDLQIKIKSDFGEFTFINFPDSAGKTALHLAISKNRFDIMMVLLKFNPDFSIQNKLGDTVLHYAVRNKGINFVRALLEAINACPNPEKYLEARNTEGLTPVQLSVSHSNATITKSLLDSNVEFYVRDEKTNETLLHRAMQMTDNPSIRKTIIEEILKHEKECLKLDKHKITSLKDRNSNTPLHQAVLKQQSDTVDILLSADPSVVLIPGDNDRTPLHMAVFPQNREIFDKIIELMKKKFETSDDSSIDNIICKQDIDGKTPVHLSIESKNLYALEKLIPLSKSCLETTDKDQDTLLHYAVKVSEEKCDYLIAVLKAFKTGYPEDFQSRLYPCNSDGFPPLQYAIELNKLPAALILIGDSNSVQLPYQDRENNIILCNPKSQLPLRILYKTSKSSKDPLSEYWIGFRIKMSSRIINWIATSLPVISPKKSTTLHFDNKSSMTEIEPNMLNANILKVILRSHSTVPFKSAVSSKLITRNIKFRDEPIILLKYVGQYSTREVIAFYIDWNKCVIFERTKEQSSLIEYAVDNSDLSVLRFLLEKLPQNLNHSLSPPRSDAAKEVIEQYEIALCLKSALRLSLNIDNVQALELLLGLNARHDHTYDGLNTLLHLIVIQHKPCEFINSLLTRISEIEKFPADPGTIRFIDAQNAQKETALHLALQTKQENTIKAILSFGPDLLTQNSDGNTPLHSSILLPFDYESVESILNLGKEQNQEIINTANKQNCTPLHLSVNSGNSNITKLLLNSKADIYCQDLHNRTVLHHAIAIANVKGNLMLINELINFENNAFSSSKLCSMQDSDGNTPLNLAIKISNYKIVTRLLEFSSVLKVVNKLKQTPLHLAVLSSNKEIFQSILDAVLQIENISNEHLPTGESIINSQDSEGHTPLHLCIRSDNPDALVKILEINPYLGTIDGEGNSILHDAVMKSNILHILLPKLLERSFPYFYYRNKTGLPPLQFAIKHRMFESIDALTKVGIKLAFATDNSETLCDMIEELSLEIVEYKCGQDAYWVGYTYNYLKSDIWILSELPTLKITIQVYKSKLNIVKQIDKDLLEKIAECSSPEPLDAAVRNEKLKFYTLLEGGFKITEMIAEKGNLQSIKSILKKNNSALIEGKDNQLSMVESAVRNPNLEVLDFLLQSIDTYQPRSISKSLPPNDFQKKRYQCLKNSLWLSIHNSTADAFSKLLSYDLSPLICTNKENETLLHLIIQNNKPTEFINLIFRAVDEKERNSPHSTRIKGTRFIDHQAGSESMSALHLCIEMGELENFNVLLTHHPDTFLTDIFQNTCLHIAAKKRELEFSKQIIGSVEKGRLVGILESVNDDKESPLHIAVKIGNINVSSYLLEVGSIANTVNIHGYSILHHAVEITDTNEQFEMIELILNHQKIHKNIRLTEIRDHTESTPLHNAIMSKNISAVKQLINFSSVLKLPDNQGNIPLHTAVIALQNDIFNCVLDYILKLEVECVGWLEQRLTCMKQRNGKTPLHLSIENRNTHALQSLLQTKPCLDVCDTNGDTVLHCAVKNSSDDSTCLEIVLKELEERFSDDYSYYTYLLNSRKLTPLHYAIKFTNLNCIKMLLEHQVNLAFLDPCGDKTLLNGIDGFLLSFVKHNSEYWIGYKFTKARKPYWILTNLPNLNHTEIVERDLPTTKISDFKLLKLISQSESTEPLDAALRNKLLNVNTSLNHEHMSQVIARHGTKQSLRCLLSKTKSGLFHRSDGKLSMIECAVSNPNIESLKYLLHSLPFQQQQPGGIANGELSFLEKHPNLGVLELNKTSDENFPKKTNENALAQTIKNSLEYSIDNDDADILNILLQHGACFTHLYDNNDTLLHMIIRKKRPADFLTSVLDKIRELQSNDSEHLTEGISMINHRNNAGKTPLHICIENGDDKLLEKLLQYHPDLTLSDASRDNILHCVAKLGSEAIAKIIFNHFKSTFPNCIPDTFFAKNKDGYTPLHFAAASGNESICSTLLEICVDLSAEIKSYLSAINSEGLSPLHQAIMNGNHRIAEKLCEYGANIAIQLPNGKLTLCNGRELKFSIRVGQPPSTWRTIKDIVWSDAKDYFVCYEIVDKGTTHHIASLLPDLESTTISTSHLNIISSATERALEVICSCHCIEPLIYAIDKGWVDFSKEDTDMQWKVLCGDLSEEITDYLYTKYPVKMKSSKMLKRLENTTKTENKDKVLSFELDRLIQNDPITINPEDGGPLQTKIRREVSQNSKLLTNFVSCLNEKAYFNDHLTSFDSNYLNKENLEDKRPIVVQDISNRTCDVFGKSLPSSKPCMEIDNTQILSLHSALMGSEGNCEYLKGILVELKHRYPEDFSRRLCSRNSKGFPPLQNAIESNNLQAALIFLEYSAQLPYFSLDNNILIRSPQSKLPLRIFYTTLKSAKHFPNVFWAGFYIQLSSDVSLNWIATNLPELSKTEYFDKNSPLEEVLKLSEELLKAILQCNSTDPFESAFNSGLITKDLRFQDGSTLLRYIGQYSTLKIMHHFINRYTYVSFECTNGEYSLIEYAVSNLNVTVLRFLLEKLPSIVDQSLSPLQQNDSREEVVLYNIALCLKNALKLSLNNDNVQALELLLDFNARYDHTYDKQQDTLLHLMVIQCKPCTFVDCLMTKTRKSEKIIKDRGTGLFIDAQNAQKETALHLALQTKQESIIKTILDFDPEIVSKDSNGNTPLHLSVLLNNYEIIEDVLKHSKQNLKLVNSVNKQNCTPLHLSVDNGDYKVTELLLRSNGDIYCQDLDKRTVLHHSLKIADSERRYLMVDKLIKFEEITFSTNTLCTMRDNNGNTPFSLAYAMSDHEIVTRLLEIPSVLKTTNESQQTPLHLAIINRNERSLKSILNAIKKTEKLSDEIFPKRDSSINSQDSSGFTPLHLSIQRKNTDALSKLLAVNPYLDIFNNDGDQPLHLAVLSEENEIFDCLLDSILKLDIGQRLICTKQRNGKTPLHLSIENRNTHALQSLLQTKPCLDVCDTNGDTVLHCAVKNSSDDSTCLEIVLKELEERFSDNYSYFTYMLNSQKLTPLHYAIKSSNLNCIKMLLEYQVNLAFLDPCGDKTLLNGIDGFLLSFVKHKGEYWIGYKFTKARKLFWILTNLPNLNLTEIVGRDLPTTNISDFDLLKLISQSESTEPLDAALRNKLLTVNTSLNHEYMSQVIARHGTKQSLRCLLSKTKYGLFHRSDGKPSMIECAVSNPNIDALDYLLHSLPTFQQQQPGDIAISEESTRICSCLKNSLQLSVSNESSEALISLLRFYPKIDCIYIDDNTLIHQMIICNKSSKFIKEVIEVIREIETSNSLYKDKQIINHSNFEKKTALHCCIERKQLSTLEVILQFNPGAFVMDENDETPLHYAVNSNELEFVQAIYQHAPCIELLSVKNNVANTALHLAVKNANDGIVKYLLECKPPFDCQNSHGSTVLHLAVLIENPTQRELIMNQLILHNANKGLNVTCIQDSELKSPLHLAVSKQYPDAVDSLLAADPRALHIQDYKKQTPFHLTIAPSCLTPKPSNPLVPVRDKESVFNNQIFDNVLGAIEQQGKHEKNCCNGKHLICMQDERKRTALHYAIEHHYSHAFKEILKIGACLDIPDEDGNSLLHEATKI